MGARGTCFEARASQASEGGRTASTVSDWPSWCDSVPADFALFRSGCIEFCLFQRCRGTANPFPAWLSSPLLALDILHRPFAKRGGLISRASHRIRAGQELGSLPW